MTWTEKEKPTPFDNQPIRGLFFLDGDVLARRIGHDWTAGQKYPMVMFPSGVECPLWETSDAERVELYTFTDYTELSSRISIFSDPTGSHIEVMPNSENRPEFENEPEPRFALGQLVATPGALTSLQEAEQSPSELIARHVTGDWGEVDGDDQQENELSVEKGYRILSAYRLRTGVKVWVITEADRSVTTILLPAEY